MVSNCLLFLLFACTYSRENLGKLTWFFLQELLTKIKAINGMAPLFERYLKNFQDEGPLIHVIHCEMKDLLLFFMKRILEPKAVDGRTMKELQRLDIHENQLEVSQMDFGFSALDEVRK